MPDTVTLRLTHDQLRAIHAWCPFARLDPSPLAPDEFTRRVAIETAFVVNEALAKLDNFHFPLYFERHDVELLAALVERAAKLEAEAAAAKDASHEKRARKRRGRKPGRPRKLRQPTIDEALDELDAADASPAEANKASL